MNGLAFAMQRPAFKAILVFVFIAGVTSVIAWAGISASLSNGRLSIPPAYDDVSYFVSAAEWLANWPGRSLASSLYALLLAHAPFSTLMAIAGFLLTPDSYVGHYAIQAIVVAAFLVGIAALLRHAAAPVIIISLTGAACFPLLIQVMNEARPDLAWGLAGGIMVGWIVNKPIQQRSLWTGALVGFCSGAVALIKPTALPVSLACFEIVFVISIVGGWFEAGKTDIMNAIRRGFVFGLGQACAIAPYLSVSIVPLTDYIWRTLVVNRAFWALNAGLSEHAIYYFWGPGSGQIALGLGGFAGFGLFAARLWSALYIRREDRIRTLMLLSATVVAYTLPTLSEVKSYYLGALFYGTFIVASSLNLAAIVTFVAGILRSSAGRWGSNLFCLTIFLALAAGFTREAIVREPRLATVFDETTREAIKSASAATWPTLRDLAAPSGRPLTVSFTSPYPVNPSLMRLYALRNHVPFAGHEEFGQSNLDEIVRRLLNADVIAAAGSIPHNLPGPRMGDEIIRALDARQELCVVKTIAVPGAPILRIYRRIGSGCSPG